MSMTMLTILQMTGIFALYSVITVGIPALFFTEKYVTGERWNGSWYILQLAISI